MKTAPFSIARDARQRLAGFIKKTKPNEVVSLVWGMEGLSLQEMKEAVVVGIGHKDEKDETWNYNLDGLIVSIGPLTIDALRDSEIVLRHIPANESHPAYTYFDRVRNGKPA